MIRPFGWVYLLKDVAGKGYVGQTVLSPMARFRQHRKTARRVAAGKAKRNDAQLVTLAMARMGSDAFSIVGCWPADSQADLDRIEVEKIREHRTLAPDGYNLEEGGRKHKALWHVVLLSHAGPRFRIDAAPGADLSLWKTLHMRIWEARQCRLPSRIPKRYRAAVTRFLFQRLTGRAIPRYMPDAERSARQSEAQRGRRHPHRGVPCPKELRLRHQARAMTQPRAGGQFVAVSDREARGAQEGGYAP